MMFVRLDKSPAPLPASPCAGDLPGQDDTDARQWTDRLSRVICDGNCPQFTDRKKRGRCTLQAIDVVPGEQCSMFKRFLSGTECTVED